jgi:hypothetical protein
MKILFLSVFLVACSTQPMTTEQENQQNRCLKIKQQAVRVNGKTECVKPDELLKDERPVYVHPSILKFFGINL